VRTLENCARRSSPVTLATNLRAALRASLEDARRKACKDKLII
jgi:hypothetical protein